MSCLVKRGNSSVWRPGSTASPQADDTVEADRTGPGDAALRGVDSGLPERVAGWQTGTARRGSMRHLYPLRTTMAICGNRSPSPAI